MASAVPVSWEQEVPVPWRGAAPECTGSPPGPSHASSRSGSDQSTRRPLAGPGDRSPSVSSSPPAGAKQEVKTCF